MHQKFLVVGRVCLVFGVISGLIVGIAALLNYDLTGMIPAPIAYFMLFSVMAAVLCLIIGFAFDFMSHLMRHDMSGVMWLFILTIVFIVAQIILGMVKNQELNYTMIFYTGFVIAAGLRGFWYIIGIRGYEIEKYMKSKKF